MLTQSRLMPDLDVLFKSSPPQTETGILLIAGQTRTAETATVYYQALGPTRRKRYAKKWIPPVSRNKISYKLSSKKSAGRSRVISDDKLYLVFCQWKTEG
ncbi:MAG: hypothetical protein V4557_20090 [Bacteroidota bacterium]